MVHPQHRLPMAGHPEGTSHRVARCTITPTAGAGTGDAGADPPCALPENVGNRLSREASPTAAVIDSQSVKSAEKGGPVSTHMAMMRARRSRGRSGIILVDLQGLLLQRHRARGRHSGIATAVQC